MISLEPFKYDPNAIKANRGSATMNWNGKEFYSIETNFVTNKAGGLVWASDFGATNTKNSEDKSVQSTLLLSFLSKTDIPERFHQSYKAGSTDHPEPWAFYHEGAKFSATEGSITGKFSNSYRTLEAEIRMLLENGESIITTFSAEYV
ncbi:hypothetical protein EJA72_04965 [Pseudomonas sp. PB120]|uniref:hypothetical protein n=1 Tax=Pseudomonas sp. PB120 TaxID=2494700 RepID=UPI0012FD1CA8|nr:hypothetical protein [Pseudomonas sp. PB120]MVV47603.1 hypothetical protein [Pseudomonas sp. PB120]